MCRSLIGARVLLAASVAVLAAILGYGAEPFIAQRTLLRTAADIQQGRPPSIAALAALDREVDIQAVIAGCRPEIVRAALAFKLQRADVALREVDSGGRDKALAEAEEAIQGALTCTRYDGLAWLRLAAVENGRNGPTGRAVEALALSHRTTPYEAWMAQARIPFAALLRAAGVEAVGPVLAEDARTLVESGREDPIIATLRRSPSAAEPFFREAIAATGPTRRERIVREMGQASLVIGTDPTANEAAPPAGKATENAD